MSPEQTTFNQFQAYAEASGISLSQSIVDQCIRYKEELKMWSLKHNLTAIRDEHGIEIKHFTDSLSLSPHINKVAGERTDFTIIDVGTGAGFPGLVLAILYPQARIILVESVAKKVAFLIHVIETLKLTNVVIKHTRMEDFAKSYTNNYLTKKSDKMIILVGRAVSKLSNLLLWTIPLFESKAKLEERNTVHALFQKSKEAATVEIEDLKLIPELGTTLSSVSLEVINIEPHSIPELTDRVLVHIW